MISKNEIKQLTGICWAGSSINHCIEWQFTEGSHSQCWDFSRTEFMMGKNRTRILFTYHVRRLHQRNQIRHADTPNNTDFELCFSAIRYGTAGRGVGKLSYQTWLRSRVFTFWMTLMTLQYICLKWMLMKGLELMSLDQNKSTLETIVQPPLYRQ